jgi:hypothetical protein
MKKSVFDKKQRGICPQRLPIIGHEDPMNFIESMDSDSWKILLTALAWVMQGRRWSIRVNPAAEHQRTEMTAIDGEMTTENGPTTRKWDETNLHI